MTALDVLGQRIRHYRTERGFTLEELGERVGVTSSQLSLVENGKREAKVSLLNSLSEALDVGLQDLLESTPPSPRAALEHHWRQVTAEPLYQSLGVPVPKITRSTSDDVLETLTGLYDEIYRREQQALATPEEARRANTELRHRMREANNYLPELETLAEDLVATSGHRSGAITHREVALMAESLGFDIVHVGDLPKTARSVTDRENGRIYLPPASIPGGHGLRSMALQAMAHLLLKHRVPQTYEEFLQQRLEINYFAAACLMPRSKAVEFLQAAKKERNIAVEDFRDAFGVTHEAASLRFTNLATEFLDIRLHFLRVVAMTVRSTRHTKTTGCAYPPMSPGQPRDRLSVDTGRPGRPLPAPTAPPSTTNTPTLRRAPSGSPPKSVPEPPTSFRSPLEWPLTTQSGSAGVTPPSAPTRRVRTWSVAGAPKPTSWPNGRARLGPQRDCKPTPSHPCMEAPSPGYPMWSYSSFSSVTNSPTKTENKGHRHGPVPGLAGYWRHGCAGRNRRRRCPPSGDAGPQPVVAR